MCKFGMHYIQSLATIGLTHENFVILANEKLCKTTSSSAQGVISHKCDEISNESHSSNKLNFNSYHCLCGNFNTKILLTHDAIPHCMVLCISSSSTEQLCSYSGVAIQILVYIV